jgi:hypothetical protein
MMQRRELYNRQSFTHLAQAAPIRLSHHRHLHAPNWDVGARDHAARQHVREPLV